MKTLRAIAGSAFAGALLIGAAATAQGATLDTTSATPNDGVLQNFTGIDWHSNGAGWIQGFDLTGANTTGDTDTFSFTYQAFAAAINTSSPTPNLFVAPPGPAVGSYELTTFANITETATCLNVGCSAINITLNSGNWQVFFDVSPDANQAAGTGFIDGIQILAGNFTSGLSTFTATGPIGPGSLGTGGGFLIGDVTATNNAFVNPDLLGTTFQASLQFPGQPTFTRPVAFAGAATGADTGTAFVLQTDTSQDFSVTAVPEPATLSLLGLGLFAMGLLGRRKQS